MTHRHCGKVTEKSTVWVTVLTLLLALPDHLPTLGLCVYGPPLWEHCGVPHLALDSLPSVGLFFMSYHSSTHKTYRTDLPSPLSWHHSNACWISLSRDSTFPSGLIFPKQSYFPSTPLSQSCLILSLIPQSSQILRTLNICHCYFSLLFYFPKTFHHQILIILSLSHL